jgi:mannose-6-phosphate isomerase-like protein (cupin superfamily)
MSRRHFSFENCSLSEVSAHDGMGAVRTCRVLGEDAGRRFAFIDLTEIPPGNSVGLHTHDAGDEEVYVIVSGKGRMHVDGEEFDVGPGDAILNVAGGTHGLINIGTEPLRMVVLDVAPS